MTASERPCVRARRVDGLRGRGGLRRRFGWTVAASRPTAAAIAKGVLRIRRTPIANYYSDVGVLVDDGVPELNAV